MEKIDGNTKILIADLSETTQKNCDLADDLNKAYLVIDEKNTKYIEDIKNLFVDLSQLSESNQKIFSEKITSEVEKLNKIIENGIENSDDNITNLMKKIERASKEQIEDLKEAQEGLIESFKNEAYEQLKEIGKVSISSVKVLENYHKEIRDLNTQDLEMIKMLMNKI